MATVLWLCLGTLCIEPTDPAARYTAAQEEQRTSSIQCAQLCIESLEKRRSSLQNKVGSGETTSLFAGKIRVYTEFVQRYEASPSLFVPRLEYPLSYPLGQVGILEYPDRFRFNETFLFDTCWLSDDYGRHEFPVLQIIDETTMIIAVGNERVCIEGMSTRDVTVGSRLRIWQVFETVECRPYTDPEGKPRKYVVARPVDIPVSDEQWQLMDEEWKARTQEAKYRIWTMTFPSGFRGMAYGNLSGKTIVNEAELAGATDSHVRLRLRQGRDAWRWERSLLSAEDQRYVEAYLKKMKVKDAELGAKSP